jgi:hypothetical protein
MAGSTILGFASDIRANEKGTAWQARCAPGFEQTDLCLQTLGFTNLPEHSKIDAVNLYLDHKQKTVEHVALRDPRRELFEENGMTCSQCHVRNFGVGDPRDPARTDPKLGRLPAPAPYTPTTMFNLVPEETWRPFMIEFQRFQECELKHAFKRYLDIDVALACPLRAE